MDRTSNASFIDSFLDTPRIIISICLIVSGLICVQVVFFYLQNTLVESAERSIRSLLRQEIVVSNLFLLSRSLSDLQDSGLIRCSVVRRADSDLPFLDLRYRSNCKSDFLSLNGKIVTSDFEALNGQKWTISFLANTGRFFDLSLWLARAMAFILMTSAISFYFSRLDREAILRRKKEDENRRLNQLVDEKVVEITELKIEASVQKSLADLAHQVSHDIRSPLSAINLVVKQIDSIPSEQRNIIQAAAERINGIANDLLKQHKTVALAGLPASLESPPVAISKKNVVIAELLRSIFAEKKALLDKQELVCLKLDLTGPTDAICAVDEKELSRVLSNLINNATEALEGNGTVTLALRSSMKKDIAVMVGDDGKGIPEDVLVRLGKEKVSYGKNHGESGSGIGVYHAKSAVEAMGGRFAIQSKVGMGTIITMTFPRTKDDFEGF